MNDSCTRYFAVLMLAMFMTGIGNVSSNSLVHDLQHDNDVKHAVVAMHHPLHLHVSPLGNEAETGGLDQDSDSLDASEHQILHALNHLQFFPDMLLADVVAPPLSTTAPLSFDPTFLASARIDLPLRPPQNKLLPA